MGSDSFFLAFILAFVSFFTEAQNKGNSNKLIAEVNMNYGHVRWADKIFIDNNNSNVIGDPLLSGKRSFVHSGVNHEFNMSLNYMIDNIGFGLYIGKNNFDFKPSDNSFSRGPVYNELILFGAVFNFEIYNSDNFSIAPELKGGSYAIRDKYDFYNEVYKEKIFINTGLKFTYMLNRVYFNLKPNYSFMYSESFPYSGLETKEFRNIFSMSFGVGINFLSLN
jgi:hypothetical protein